MYCVYENISWYIHGGPLFGGGPLLGGSVIRGSGVSRIFVRGVLRLGILYDCACVNPKCYPYDFRTRRGLRQVVVL